MDQINEIFFVDNFPIIIFFFLEFFSIYLLVFVFDEHVNIVYLLYMFYCKYVN